MCRMESQAGTSRAAEPNSPRYDVFINCRGGDAKKRFVCHLDDAFRRARLRPFLDAKDIELGRDVNIAIREALEGSRVHLAVFCKEYAQSKDCLDELCIMLESGKNILPVFYHVEPAEVRMTRNGPFREGFRKRSESATEEQISKWKEALQKISYRMGSRLDEVNGNEADLVSKIVAQVQQWMSTVPSDAEHAPVAVAIDQEELEPELATFNPGDRTLNILVMGDPDSVESIVSSICGARRRQTPVQGHVSLTESRNSSPPMCLYNHTEQTADNTSRDIRTFVMGRSEKWRPAQLEASWEKVVHCSHSSNWAALFRDINPDGSTSRLHMVWYVCRKLSDLPNLFEWREIMKMLCGLPVQILVIEERSPGTQDVSMNVPKEFDNICKHRSDFFPNAPEFMEDLVVKVDLQENDPKGELWRKCWALKTRVEIGYAAEVIRDIRKRLGSTGISVRKGVGGARLPKKVSLSRSGEFILHFLCAYWNVPQDSLRPVLQGTTAFVPQASDRKISIEHGEFVELCLKVAAIILYNARDNARNPKYVCSWNDSSGSSLRQLLTEAQECCGSYFSSSPRPYQYDKMKSEDIRRFLETIFERNVWDAPPLRSVDGNSFVIKIKKRFRRADSPSGTQPRSDTFQTANEMRAAQVMQGACA